MNHTFKVVRDTATGTFKAVSETAKGQSKSSKSSTTTVSSIACKLRGVTLSALVLASLGASVAHADFGADTRRIANDNQLRINNEDVSIGKGSEGSLPVSVIANGAAPTTGNIAIGNNSSAYLYGINPADTGYQARLDAIILNAANTYGLSVPAYKARYYDSNPTQQFVFTNEAASGYYKELALTNTALGMNSFAMNGGTSIGAGSHSNGTDVVSFGKINDVYGPEIKRRLTNVADGINSSDAVTIGQLNQKISEGIVNDSNFADIIAGNAQQDIDIAGKADKTYVDSQDAAQDTAVRAKNDAQDALINAATTKNTQQDTAIAGKADTTAVNTKNDAQDALINAATTKNTQQDTAIAGKANQTDLATTNTTVANNKADADAKNTATNTTVANNKAQQAVKDGQQDDLIANNKADADANNTATNTRVDATNTTVANNKADADAKNTATNDRITNETNRLDKKDSDQDAIINANQTIINSKFTDVNDRITEAADKINSLDAKDADQDAIIAQNKADQAVKDTAQDTLITTNTQTIVKNKADQAVKDGQQDDLIANNKTDSDAKDAATNVRVDDTNTRIDVTNTIVANNKADQAVKDGQQDDLIANNTQTIINNKTEQATTDASQNTVITNNRNEYITNNTITNDRIDATNTVITNNKADQVVKDGQQDDLIANNNTTTNTKIDKVVTDAAATNTAQDNIIANNQQNIDKLDKEKADITYVDQQNKDLANSFITNMASSSTTINNTINQNNQNQAVVDTTQNNRLDRNEKEISAMGYRIEQMDGNLSGGIASASAIAFMPTPNAGGRMMTGGAANYNGESAIAIGITATTDSGKYTYRFGGTFSTSGGSVIGGGLGMSF